MGGITAVKAPGVTKRVIEILGIGAHGDAVDGVVCEGESTVPVARTSKPKPHTSPTGAREQAGHFGDPLIQSTHASKVGQGFFGTRGFYALLRGVGAGERGILTRAHDSFHPAFHDAALE